MIGIHRDEDARAVLRPLLGLTERAWATQAADNPRALDPAELARVCRRLGAQAQPEADLEAALNAAVTDAQQAGQGVVWVDRLAASGWPGAQQPGRADCQAGVLTVASGAQPLGMVLGGAAVDAIGLAPTVLLLGACSQPVGVGLLFVPALHELDRQDSSV